MVRLQKILAEAGVASRRASEQIILAGRVSVNGAVVRELGTKVNPDSDRVAVDGTPLKSKRKLYLAVNKPPGFVCSRAKDTKQRKLSDLLPTEWEHLFSVGRLDAESEGLIFVTNDGDFCLRLTHPRYGVMKVYRATVVGFVEASMLQRMKQGIEHEGEMLRAEHTRLLKANHSHSLVELTLKEGKNREVRRLFEAHGMEVERLQRTQIGRIRLAELPLGKWRALTEPEIKSLLGNL